MQKKNVIKIIVDVLMTAAMPILMSYMLAGAEIHEWIGAGIFLLFILHHILNYKWISALFKGKYTVVRAVNTAVNILVFVCMLGLMYSGIVLSRYVFAFLPIEGGTAFARKIHMLCSYWGFAFMSLHLGMHWNFIMGMIRKMTKVKKSNIRSIVFKALAAVVVGYGIYAFIKRGIADYMLLKTQFVFFDMSEPLIAFLLDYAAIMGLFAVIGHYFLAVVKKLSLPKKQGE